MTPTELRMRADDVLAALETVIIGKRDALHLLLAAILADGHVLIEDVPGLAKTAIARATAQVLGLPCGWTSSSTHARLSCRASLHSDRVAIW